MVFTTRYRLKWMSLAWLVTVAGVISCGKDPGTETPEPKSPTPYNWIKPAHFPEPVYDFSENPLTQEGVKLGMFLFYDGIMSRTNVVGCGTCHQQQAAFTHHGHELSHGVDDLIGIRNSPAVQNVAWSTSFFWDGGVPHLDLVPLNPIGNPVELDESVPTIISKLNAGPRPGAKMPIDYPKMFQEAFGSREINTERMMKALSQFMLTMVSATSKYDFYLMGDQAALSATEKEGLQLFRKNCTGCHAGVLQTDQSFRNNGLYPARIDDKGRFDITGKEEDRYKFKVPSLRNIGVTAPYMHDGRYHSLEEVLQHYNDSVGLLANSGLDAAKTLDPLLADTKRPGIPLSNEEQKAIIAFLHTLTDEVFLKNPKLADPGIGNAL
ncbi:cytochrome-c peroxidase [Ravibacter arvi]